jgi:hypothetical protein
MQRCINGAFLEIRIRIYACGYEQAYDYEWVEQQAKLDLHI